VSLYVGTPLGLSKAPAWTTTGGSKDANLGDSVSAGDVNGDGLCDLAIGSPDEHAPLAWQGRVRVYEAAGP
jgi:hypothetical protein